MILPQRIRERLTSLNLSQAELARQVGIAQPTIARILSGSSKSSSHLHRIARVLQTTPAYLSGETDDASEGALPVPTPDTIARELGLHLVPELALGYSMGGSAVLADYQQVGSVPFSREWLRGHMRGTLADLFVATGSGDSMQPTMLDGDTVLIDTAQKVIDSQDKIWAISYGDLGMIKRVRRAPGGTYQILSDNQAIVAFTAANDELHVVGRVIWIGRWM